MYVCVCTRMPKEGVGFHEAVVKGVLSLLDMVAGNWTWIFLKEKQVLLTADPSFQPFNLQIVVDLQNSRFS